MWGRGGSKLTQRVAQVAAAQEWQQQQEHESAGCTLQFQHRIKGDKRSAQVLPLEKHRAGRKSLAYAPCVHGVNSSDPEEADFFLETADSREISCSESYCIHLHMRPARAGSSILPSQALSNANL